MSELDFEVAGAEPDRYAAVPTLTFKLNVSAADAEAVHALALKVQIRIEPQRRRYVPDEEDRLLAMFGETSRWGDSLRPFLWTHASMVVPGFTGATEVELPIACTYDFEVSASKYMSSLSDGEIPLILLFSGTAFAMSDDGRLRVDPVPWHKEASYRLPVSVWREMMNLYFPHGGWLRLPQDTIDALERFRAEEAFATMEQAVEALLKTQEASSA